jgi:hypothetical protein
MKRDFNFETRTFTERELMAVGNLIDDIRAEKAKEAIRKSIDMIHPSSLSRQIDTVEKSDIWSDK